MPLFNGDTWFWNTGEWFFLISSVPLVYPHFNVKNIYKLLNILMETRNLGTEKQQERKALWIKYPGFVQICLVRNTEWKETVKNISQNYF